MNELYRRYTHGVRFYIDPCLTQSPAHKVKADHLVRTHRARVYPSRRPWRDLAALQAWKHEHLSELAHLRRCPATAQSVFDSG